MSDLAIIPGELPTFTGESLQEHLEAWQKAFTYRELMNWGLGAVASSLKGKYGANEIGNFAQQVDVSPRHLYDLAKTFEVWKPLGINPRLSFTHHRIAAKAEDPKLALETAEHEQLSTRQLEQFIETGELPNGLPAFEPEIEEPELEKVYPKRSLGAWYDFIASHPCLRCGNGPVEVAHVEAFPSDRYSGFMPRRKGLSQFACVPLCPDCHRHSNDSIHAIGERSFMDSLGKPAGFVFGWLAKKLVEFFTQ